MASFIVEFLQLRLRAWKRSGRIFFKVKWHLHTRDSNLENELITTSSEGEECEHFLNLLLDQGWKPAGATDPWDLEKDRSRFLMATERGDGPAKRILVRIMGPISAADLKRSCRFMKG